MNAQELTYLFENTSSASPREAEQLEEILEKYPYFQAARAVYLKSLYTQNSLKYNAELKKTAAYTSDRSILFDFITSKEFNQDKIAFQIKKQEENLRNITVFEHQEVYGGKSIAIDEAIKMKKKESERVMDPDLFGRAEKPEEEKVPTEQDSTQHTEPGSPLDFDASESHSFSEWLSLTRAKPVDRSEENSKENQSSISRKLELIDDFISKSPKIKPGASGGTKNIAQERLVPPEALMTETLARVYLEQKNFKKAIQAYKILILKNPEKSGFFADQIRAIKKLQDNNNTGKE